MITPLPHRAKRFVIFDNGGERGISVIKIYFLLFDLREVQRTGSPCSFLLCKVQIDHRRGHIRMAKNCLERANIDMSI